MTIEEKKEYLNGYRLCLLKIGRFGELMQSFPKSSEMYAERLSQSIAERDKLEREIDSVDGGKLSELLCQKYICGKSLEEIGYTMNYSKRHIERMHIKALEKFNIG